MIKMSMANNKSKACPSNFKAYPVFCLCVRSWHSPPTSETIHPNEAALRVVWREGWGWGMLWWLADRVPTPANLWQRPTHENQCWETGNQSLAKKNKGFTYKTQLSTI